MSNYAATDCIVVKKADGTWKSFNPEMPADIGNRVGAIAIDDFQTKWIQFPRGNGILVFNDNGTIDDESDDVVKVLGAGSGNGNLHVNYINAIAVDKQNEIWVGTSEGINIFYTHLEIFTGTAAGDATQPLVNLGGYYEQLLRNDIVNTIAVDGANRKWVSTRCSSTGRPTASCSTSSRCTTRAGSCRSCAPPHARSRSCCSRRAARPRPSGRRDPRRTRCSTPRCGVPGRCACEPTRMLFAAARLLASGRIPRGDRIAVVANGRGPALLAADSARDAGIPLADFEPSTIAALDTILPEESERGNPVDVRGDAPPERFAAAVGAVISDPEVDAVIALHVPRPVDPPTGAGAAAHSRARRAVLQSRAPAAGRRREVRDTIAPAVTAPLERTQGGEARVRDEGVLPERGAFGGKRVRSRRSDLHDLERFLAARHPDTGSEEMLVAFMETLVDTRAAMCEAGVHAASLIWPESGPGAHAAFSDRHYADRGSHFAAYTRGELTFVDMRRARFEEARTFLVPQ